MNQYNEDFRLEDGVLHVRLTGTFPDELLHSGHNLFQPLIDACSNHDCRRALIDARGLTVAMDTAGLFQAGKDVVSLTKMGITVAIIAREDMLDPFFETVAANRGGTVRVFTEMDTARAWLERT